jgi:hypothetical protein
MAEKSARRTWLWVVVGIIAILVIGFAIVIGLGMMVVTRNMQVTAAGQEAAEQTFDEARERFAGQVPLVVLEEGAHDAVVARAELDRRIASYSGPAPEHMWVLVWDPGEKRVVKLSIPFWLLRMSPGGNVKLNLPGLGTRQSNITTKEIERAGPGLFLDGRVEGAMILVWTE